MSEIEEKIISDLEDIHEGFSEIRMNDSNEAEIVFEDGNKVEKGEVSEDTKTYQIMRVYEDIKR